MLSDKAVWLSGLQQIFKELEPSRRKGPDHGDFNWGVGEENIR